MRGKRIVKCSMVLLVLCLMGIWQYEFHKVNEKYPQAEVENYISGEVVNYDDTQVTVENAEWISPDEMMEKNWRMDTDERLGDYKVLEFETRITNVSDKPTTVNLTEFRLEMSGFCNGISMEAFFMMNGENITSMILDLKKGESILVHIPYVLNQISFKDKYWKTIEEKKAGITISLYPVKKYICGLNCDNSK